MTRVGVIGAGAFGTALASVARLGGNNVTLWGRDPAQITAMQAQGENTKYLPDVALPEGLHLTNDLGDLAQSDIILMVLPAQQLRSFLARADLPTQAPVLLCAKGIESDTGLLQQQILTESLPNTPIAVLSGPGFASEMTRGKPTALSLGCDDPKTGAWLQGVLSSQTLRLYLTQDTTGVALGGALKNVYAIACGLVVGAGLGESARAALMTRGFAELARLAASMGAKTETLMGLSGFGDLALSCTSLQSRNFAFGEKLGREGAFGTGKTVEGIATAQAVLALAARQNVEMPIAQAVADVLDGRQEIAQALHTLMSRPLKPEA
ncbi:NAD(P)H-dependent glycerol-3-phosphate dehydrogenase [Roseobacter sp. N2S]|uniref:NAD(P)H-dependent glycerol-3-phosphate dehydrogenase n=1 Tax=Roseobacter sp. N2S TaxID=2663844 RepID=UPI00285AFD89|nr:NAD(P)H-dependent glycerol-3-phosphate dehydrogenase [Roseobacter sp. N2S]MDR6263383.1 glycerol-3-phosphate dehydrogenase (NAD(P)+) [Roseobacter sp. N2S]